jgi:hypothetical protein
MGLLLAHRALYLIARSARCDVRWVAAVFVRADETEKRCSAISSCTQLAAGAGARCARAPFERSAARTSGIRLLRHTARRWGWRSLRSACLCGRSQRKERLCSLRVHCSLRSLRLALVSPLPSSLARRRRTCRSSRTAARQPGSARRARDSRRSQHFEHIFNRLGKRGERRWQPARWQHDAHVPPRTSRRRSGRASEAATRARPSRR